MSSHVQLIVPGETACYACAPPLGSVVPASIKRNGVCAASNPTSTFKVTRILALKVRTFITLKGLPTTIALTAALMVQTTLKWLLDFGDVTMGCLYYNGLYDYFYEEEMKFNPDCPLAHNKKAATRTRRNQRKDDDEGANKVDKDNDEITMPEGISLVESGYSAQKHDSVFEENIRPSDLDELRAKLAAVSTSSNQQ